LEACECVCADTLHDPAHCGGCFSPCNAAQVKVATCDQGKCKAAVCDAGFADADGEFANGCECVVSAEQCDGKDNDCNGQVDEGMGLCAGEGECQGQCVDAACVCPESCVSCEETCKPEAFFETSAMHCGGCNQPCTADSFPGVLYASCKAGKCVPGPCTPGWFDTQPDVPGCECYKTSVVEKCDGMDNDCDGQTDEQPVTDCKSPMLCLDGVCNCDPELPSMLLCGGVCVDALTSVAHCGDCATNCFQMGWANVDTYACQEGQCVIKGCDGGFVDVDLLPDNGCECMFNSPVEQCNGADDDCDGLVDEEASGEGALCNTGMSPPCAAGKMVCNQGKLSCKPDIPPGTFLETCNGKDDDCDGEIDDDIPEAGLPCEVPGTAGPCLEGKLECLNAKITCVTQFQQFPEVCDGVDSDCDGTADDSTSDSGKDCDSTLPGKCQKGVTHCVNAEIECVPLVVPGEQDEQCNGLDDDCDGVPDNGDPGGGISCQIPNKLGECAKGLTSCIDGDTVCLGDIQPGAEVCDGLDNDCNGKTDETVPGAGEPCQVAGKQGECQKGTMLCGPNGLTCTQTVQPASEKCDGLDNNCNGDVDDGNPEGGAPCVLDNLQGPCKQGMVACMGAKLSCKQTNFGSPEQCDGQDNNCNGSIDDDPNDIGGGCQVPGGLGICANGTLICQGGNKTCKQTVFGQQETCDGQDNNCNGKTDEDGAAGCSTWFYDGDNDGYAQNGAMSKCLCSPSYPYTATVQGDCNDNSNSVYPGATEKCDGLDNNCNFQTDEPGASGCKTYYVDNDGDGYGTSQSSCQCNSGGGYTATQSGDCNDQSFNIKPGATEKCDGVDDNCNGVKDDGAQCQSGYACQSGSCVKQCSDVFVDASWATIHSGGGGPSAYYTSCSDHWYSAGWHAGTGANGINIRWTWTSTCSIPGPSNPLSYPGENARWSFTTSAAGNYDIQVKIPSEGYVCTVNNQPPSNRYASDVYYGLARSGETGAISSSWNTANYKGQWMTVFSNIHLNKGTHTLILYDHGSTATGACADPNSGSSRFVFVDSVQVKCK